MDAWHFCQISFLLLLLSAGDVQCIGRVDSFNVTRGPAGHSLIFSCRIRMSLSSYHAIHVDKTFANLTWSMYVDDEVSAEFTKSLEVKDKERFGVSSVRIDKPEPSIENTYTIYNVKQEDTGNYTCRTSNSSRSIYVFVRPEVINVTMFKDDELILPSEPPPIKRVHLNHPYRLICTTVGVFPSGNLRLASDGGAVPGPAVYSEVVRRGSEFLSLETREATLTVAKWTANISFIGRPLRRNSSSSNGSSSSIDSNSVLSVGFIPIVENDEPLFDCSDTVHVPAGERDLVMTCEVYNFPLSIVKLHVHWHDAKNHHILNISTKAPIPPGDTKYNLTDDENYQLGVRAPTSPSDHWWSMTLRVRNVRLRPTSHNNVKFIFNAVNQELKTNSRTITAKIVNGATCLSVFSTAENYFLFLIVTQLLQLL